MWKKDISKQNFFLSAPIYGKYSEILKGFCLLKVLEKKREVKDGITVMKQCLAQKKENLFIRVFHLNARNTVRGEKSERGNKYILLNFDQSLNVYDFVLECFIIYLCFLKVFVSFDMRKKHTFYFLKVLRISKKKNKKNKNQIQIHKIRAKYIGNL